MSVLSNTLFEAHGVSALRIPPGKPSLSKWKTDASKVVWKGSVRLIEQEMTEITGPSAIYEGLRLKLELYNHSSHLLPDSPDALVPWAEVWYNPWAETSNQFCIANDGEDTISVSAESNRYYKIVTQLPGTGYHPWKCQSSQSGLILQVALGLKFDDAFAAISFAEALGIYRKRFNSYQDTYLYNQHLSDLQQKIIDDLVVSRNTPEKSDTPDCDDDEFGGFVGSSYD